MKKLLLILLILPAISCSKDDDNPIDTAKAKAEEYVNIIRSLDPSLSKLTFDGIQEKTMTSYKEYWNYWEYADMSYIEGSPSYHVENIPTYPIADLMISERKLYRVLAYFALIDGYDENAIKIGDKFYEVHYKLSPKAESKGRFIVVINKDMQVANSNACNSSYAHSSLIKECLQEVLKYISDRYPE
jgi:hypothetical protein